MKYVGIVGSGGAEKAVPGKNAGEGGIAEKEGEKVVVAVLKDLAVDGGVLAALDKDQGGSPAVQVFHHEAVLLEVELLEPAGRDAMARRGAGLVAEDGGQQPQVRVTLGEDEVVAEGGENGVVDRGSQGGNGVARGEIAEKSGVRNWLWLLDVGGKGLRGIEVEVGEI